MKAMYRLAVVIAVLAAVAVRAQETVNVDEVKKQRTELQNKVRELDQKLGQIRATVARDAELAPQAKAVSDARTALEAKARNDAKVADAAKAAETADKKVREVSEAEAAASPEVAAAARDVAGKQAEIEELEAQQRLARFLLGEAERKVAGDADVKQAGTAARAAQDGIRVAHDANEPLVAAAKAAADARTALNAKIKALPESAALEQAEKAYQDLLKKDAGVMAAKTKAEAARQAQAEIVKQKTVATPAGGEQQRKLDELAGKVKAAGEAVRAAEKKTADARREVISKSAKVAEAQKAASTANDAVRQATVEATKVERAAVESAQKEFAAAADKRFANNADVIAMNKEKAELQAKIKVLDDQLRPPKPAPKKPAAAEKPAAPAKE